MCVVNVVSIFTGNQKRIYSHVGFSLEKLSLFFFFSCFYVMVCGYLRISFPFGTF